MAVLVEMHHTGDPALRAEAMAAVEHALADGPGDYRVSIIGSQANDRAEKMQCQSALRRTALRATDHTVPR